MRIKFTSNIKYSLLVVGMVLAVNSIHAQFQKGSDIDGEAAYDYSGYLVSMPDANTLAIGAPYNDGSGIDAGSVRIYHWNGSAWDQKGSDIDGEVAGDRFGRSLCMPNANTVVIGTPLNDGNGFDAGHVRIYTWNGSSWVQKGNDIDGEADELAGWSVGMPDSNTVVIGAPGNGSNGINTGAVRIYDWNGSTWQQRGSDIDGEMGGDLSGWSVSMPDTNTVAIGAPSNSGNGNASGHVRIYTWNGSAWVQKGSDIDGEAIQDQSGNSVSMPDANTLAIGANNNSGNGTLAGQVRIYKWSGSVWVQKGSDIDGEAAYDNSGYSVSMPDSNTVAIGATDNDGNGNNAGHVRIYSWNPLTNGWVQNISDIEAEAAGDNSGWSVSMPNAYTVAIGAPDNMQNGYNAGHVRIYSICSPLSGTESVTACNSYDWIDGNTYTSSNTTATHTLTNAGGCDSVVTLNLTIDYATTGTDIQTACSSFTWIDGNTYTSSNTTATHTLTNVAGCDSVVTLNLTINSVDVSVTNNTPTLTAILSGATYQWIDCNNGNTVIAGETNQSFTATANGNYAVIVTQNGCSDTSACLAINTIGIQENNLSDELLIYPNPTNGEFTIVGLTKGTTIELSNAIGIVVLRLTTSDPTTKIDLSKHANGVYLIKTTNGYTLKLVKQD